MTTAQSVHLCTVGSNSLVHRTVLKEKLSIPTAAHQSFDSGALLFAIR